MIRIGTADPRHWQGGRRRPIPAQLEIGRRDASVTQYRADSVLGLRPARSPRLVQQVSEKALRDQCIITVRQRSPRVLNPLVRRSLSHFIADIPKGAAPSVLQLGERVIRRL